MKQVLCSQLPDQTTEHLPVAEVPLQQLYLLYGSSNQIGVPIVNGERRKQYPKQWESLARQCKEQAGWRCNFCQITQGSQRVSHRTGAVYTVYLHAAHRDHDLANPLPVLLCLCPTCHGRYDYAYRRREQHIAVERWKHQRKLVVR